VTLLRLRVALLVAAVGAQLVLFSSAATPTYALSNGSGAGIGMHGFDTCQDPSQRTAKAWWTNTPWSWIGLYVGGREMACSQPNLTSAYLNNLRAMGWRFQFIWVGPQAPCSGFGVTFSSNATTAYSQGQAEARSARSKLIGLGITNQAKGSPLVFDLEAFNPSSCNALAAAKSFVKGWVDQLQVAPAQSAGVYGSTCASQLQSYAGSHQPDFIWGANYDGNQHTSAMSCVSASSWASHQRLKQYIGGHNETWGGVTLNIDTDCSNGPVAPTGGNFGTACS
jgi:Domain of unknown function (DUF1906)